MPRVSRKHKIVEAAAQLFGTKGYRATTVRDIAERAGVLSGSLYAHIATKEDLLLEIVREAARDFSRALEPIVASDASAAQKLRRAVHAHLAVVAASQSRARVYLDEREAFSDIGLAEARALRKRYEAYWEAILEDGMTSGEFDLPDPKLARLLILSALNGVNRWYQPQGRLTPDQIAESYANFLLRMMQSGL